MARDVALGKGTKLGCECRVHGLSPPVTACHRLSHTARLVWSRDLRNYREVEAAFDSRDPRSATQALSELSEPLPRSLPSGQYKEVVPALGRWRQEAQKFKAILIYLANSRSA